MVDGKFGRQRVLFIGLMFEDERAVRRSVKSVKIRAANERDVTLSFSLSYEARSLGVVAAQVEASSLESVVFSTVIWMQ